MNILAITAIIVHFSTFSIDVYTGTKLAAHCYVTQMPIRNDDTLSVKLVCEAPNV